MCVIDNYRYMTLFVIFIFIFSYLIQGSNSKNVSQMQPGGLGYCRTQHGKTRNFKLHPWLLSNVQGNYYDIIR